MKTLLPLTLAAAAAFSFTACDEAKKEEAKGKAKEAGEAVLEAGKATGSLIKDATGKALEKGGDLAAKGLEKTGDAAHALSERIKGTKDKIKDSPQLESFKTQLNGFSTMMTNLKGQAGDSPAKAKQFMDELMVKLKGISTEGVPADLSGPLKDYATAMTRIHKLSLSAPADPVAAEKWQMEHAVELQQLEKDSMAASKALKEAAAKHGMGNIDLGSE